MTDKELPEALKLADWLEAQANCEANETEDKLNASAAELRRLHARVVELVRDAARYQWIVENAVIYAAHFKHEGRDPASTKLPLDNAIDAALSKEGD